MVGISSAVVDAPRARAGANEPVAAAAFVQGLGLATPARSATLDDPELQARAAQDGFEAYGAAEPGETVDLLASAAMEACRDAGVTPDALDEIICLRNLCDARFGGAWLSLSVAARIGHAGRCLDIRACACAGFAHGVDLARRLLRSGGRILVVGGGASGYGRRWLDHVAEFDAPPPDDMADVPVLLGDGAYAAVLGADAGRYRILASEVALDPSRAEAHSVVDGETRPRSVQDKRSWREAGPADFMRVLARASRTARRPLTPATLVGTNCGLETKQRLARALAGGEVLAPRQAAALHVQLEQMRRLGHLFGGDMVANLIATERAGLVEPGDLIVGVEFGEFYYASALALEAGSP